MAPAARPTPPHVFAVLPSGCRLWASSREAARATVIRVLQAVEAADLAAGRRAAIEHADTLQPKSEIWSEVA